MSRGGSLKQIVRIRTFKDDAARARGEAPDTPPAKTPKAVPQRTPRASAPPLPPVRPVTHASTVPARDTDAVPPPHRAVSRPGTKPQVRETVPAAPRPEAPAKPQPVRASKSPAPLRSVIHDDLVDASAGADLGGDGTIVTDTKRDRFRLFPAIYNAVKEWLFEKREAYEERQQPKHTVTPAQTRKKVIAEAASASALAPTDDHRAVRERLRHVPRTKAASDVTIKEASAVPAPSWSQRDDRPRSPVPKPKPQPAPPPAPEPEPVSRFERAIFAQSAPAPQPAAIPPPEPPPPPPQPKPRPAVAPRAPATRRTVRQSAARPRRAYLGIIVVSVIASLLGVGATAWFFARTDTTPVPVATSESGTGFLDSSAKHPVALGESHVAFMRALAETNAASRQSAVVEFYPIISPDVAADLNDTLGVFTPEAPGSFLRSITALGFGSYRGAPFIVIKTSTFDTALGGMLAWEPHMSRDLAPFFGTEGAASTFSDTLHANRDIRVLADTDGDRIVYSFLNRSTILVSTDRSVIEDLSPLIH